jgi:hypothetical protein
MALTKITSTNIEAGGVSLDNLADSSVTAGTHGHSSGIPVITVNSKGIITGVEVVTVAGVSDFTYNSLTEVLTISTADGSTFNADISTLASQTYVDTALANLIDSAPGALDTLNELAAAIGDDANFAATVTNSLATKVDKINITGATVGSSTQIPVITYNAQGQITSTTTTAVAGIDSVTFTNGTLTIAAGDGTNYTTDFDARYFTETEANSNFLGINAKAADADLFDGLNSTQFLRSDANNTFSGILRIGNMQHQPSNGGRIGFNRDTTSGAIFDSNYAAFQINGAYSGFNKFAIEAYNSSGVGTTALVISETGNVGIGTDNPGKKLDVNGEARITAGLTITPAVSAVYATDSTLSSYATGNGVYLNGHANGWLRLNGSGANRASIDVWGENYAAPFGDSITFRTGGTADRMMIAASGNVGIGVTNPAAMLEFGPNTTDNRYDIKAPADNARGIGLGNYTTFSTRYSSWDTLIGTNIRSKIGTSESGEETASSYTASGGAGLRIGFQDLEFKTYSPAELSGLATGSDVNSLGTTRFKVNTNGNVGIGTTSPTAKLDVNGDVSASFFLSNTTINTSYTIPSGKNAMTAGPVTIADGVTITVPDGSTWTVV